MKQFSVLAFLTALLFPFASPANGAEADNQLVTIIARGAGDTVNAAKKEAYRTAVEQVVGTLVDADTLVENDELVNDQILTYSAAYVESAEVLGKPSKGQDGLIRVRIKAVVRKTKLEEKLRAVTTTTMDVSGESLFAQMVSQQSQWDDAKKLVESIFDKLPLKVLEASVVQNASGKPDVAMDPATGEVSVRVRLRVDLSKYDLLVKEVDRKLKEIAVFREEGFPREAPTGEPAKGGAYFFDGFPQARKRRYENANSLFLVKSLPKRTAILYEFDDNTFKRIQPFFWAGERHGTSPANLLVVNVKMLDRGGDEIGSGRLNLADRRGIPYHSVCGLVEGANASSANCVPQNRLMIAPLPELPIGNGYPMGQDMRYYVNVPEDDQSWRRPPELNYEDGSAVRKGSEMEFRVNLGSYEPDQLKRVVKLKCELELSPMN